MSEDPFSIADSWLDYQQQYWKALSSLVPNDTPKKNAFSGQAFNFAQNPWSDSLESWWKNTSDNVHSPGKDFYSQIVEQGKAYIRMAENLSNAMQSANIANQTAEQWQDALNQTLNSMKDGYLSSDKNAQDGLHKWMGMGELPVDHWQRIASSLSFMPGDFLQGLNTPDLTHMEDSIKEHLDQFISAPGVGHMRERQGQYQELCRLGINYLSALQDYLKTHNQIALKSIERMQSGFSIQETGGKQLDSFRDIYDLWVDCCEDVYADSVNTDEYTEIYGSLVNSLMALKRHSRMMADETLGALNMPTRKEINTLHERFHQEWRENKKLRAEMENLKELVTAMSKPKPATKRSTARKTSAKSGAAGAGSAKADSAEKTK